MHIESKDNKIPFYIGIGFLLCAIAVELLSVLFLNNGLLVYTLDDPYIHMALAENVFNGHYGVNTREFSAPSSSILWTFIIAPFSHYEYFPFIINVVSAIASVFFFVKILQTSLNIDNQRVKSYFISATVVSIILATNAIGLPFTGMEHSLQVLLAILIAYGLIFEIEKGKLAWWLLIAIIIAPLVRYECMAISVPALIYLVKQRYFKQSFITFILLIILISGFSVFLMSLGLEPFPNSVTAKSSVVASGGKLYSFITNLKSSLMVERQGIIMSFGVLALMLYLFFSKDEKRKQLAMVTILAVFMHFIAGRYGWYHRYEIYIWSFQLLVILYVFGPIITIFIEKKSLNLLGIIAAVNFPVVLAGIPYVFALFTLPIAANNIYEQQYQMHRFVVNYYDKPIAVNDLGYVSYKNNNYVLDLWGLASEKAFQYRKNSNSRDWLREICKESNIGLVMIYQGWFKHIPDEWTKVGVLHLGKRKITPAEGEVVFYATKQGSLADISRKLRLFIKTLPPGVKFNFQDNHS